MQPAASQVVSDTVQDGLIRGLQADMQALRDENKAVGKSLAEAERAQHSTEQKVDALRAENDELRRQLRELQSRLSEDAPTAAAGGAELADGPLAEAPSSSSSSFSSPPPPPPAAQEAAIDAGGELEREIIHALEDALGTQGDESWEGAAGAARRRSSVKTSSSIASAAVRTAKRAQAVWAAEHAKLRDEMREAQRAERARLTELEDCQAQLRRLKLELNASRRGLQDARSELQRAEAKVRDAEQRQHMEGLYGEGGGRGAASSMEAASHTRSNAGVIGLSRRPSCAGSGGGVGDDAPSSMRAAPVPCEPSSGFASYMEHRQQQQMQQQQQQLTAAGRYASHALAAAAAAAAAAG